MYILLFVLNAPFAYMGDYKDLAMCQNAIKEIYLQRINPPGKRLPELNQTIEIQLTTSKEFLCVKKN